jgi:hypothetical protein
VTLGSLLIAAMIVLTIVLIAMLGACARRRRPAAHAYLAWLFFAGALTTG